MADPMTELAKEFLETNNYAVRKETKFQKSRKLAGTPSDIDIIAISPRGIQTSDLQLGVCLIGEVKCWSIMNRAKVDEVYKDKFHFIDLQPKPSWRQLRSYLPSRRFDRVLFCRATNQDSFDYAWNKYGIKIVTAGQMIKNLASFFKTSDRNWTYYPERYNYNVIRTLMLYLFDCDKYKDKLTLEDLVWIDPTQDVRYKNRFAETNKKFLEEFVYSQSSGGILSNLIERYANDYPDEFKKELKSNQKFWKYLLS